MHLQCVVVVFLSFCDFDFVGSCLFLPPPLITFVVMKSFSFPFFDQNFSVVVNAVILYKLDYVSI
jgi:hypothetical protein